MRKFKRSSSSPRLGPKLLVYSTEQLRQQYMETIQPMMGLSGLASHQRSSTVPSLVPTAEQSQHRMLDQSTKVILAVHDTITSMLSPSSLENLTIWHKKSGPDKPQPYLQESSVQCSVGTNHTKTTRGTWIQPGIEFRSLKTSVSSLRNL